MSPERYDARFNEAMRLRGDGRFEVAVQILQELMREGRDTDNARHLRAAVKMIGNILYYGLHDPDRALPFLLMTVGLCPHWELGSYALFRALLDTGQSIDAYREVERFVTSHETDIYRVFFEDNEELFRRLRDESS